MPGHLELQLACAADQPPDGDGWLHEIKFDGYRLVARLEDGRARLWTRNGKDWTDRFPRVVEALERLPASSAVLDGEVVALMADGRSSFEALQKAGDDSPLLYYAFDLLFLDGLDVTVLQQDTRKELLRSLVSGQGSEGFPVRFSDHLVGQGPVFFRQACAAGLEGVVSKRRSARYRAGRTGDWIKVKCLREQEFVVVGFTEPAGARGGLGALLLGTRDPSGFVYRGRVGTGFSDAVLENLRLVLQPLVRNESALAAAKAGPEFRGVRWVDPEVVVQVAFTEMTSGGVLRHPVFRRVREDKSPEDVVLDQGPLAVRLPADQVPASLPSGRPLKQRSREDVVLGGIRITNPDRMLYPECGITKEALGRYYQAVGAWMVPHLRDRPLTLVRCPQGHGGGCFFQKHLDEIDSPHVRKVRVNEDEGARDFGSVASLSGILELVQLGVLELHTWNSRSDRLDSPDRVTLDIDPDPTVTWDVTVQAAHEIRTLLRVLDLECFVKTTGGKGLHVVVPLVRRSGWSEVKDFARAVMATVAAASPGCYTLEMSKARRTGRVLLDYLRNTRGATAIEAYSTRARPGAPVSTPVSWEELGSGIDPRSFTVESVPARLASGVDPWREYGAVKQSLTAPLKKRLGLS